jgi:hypothetical protein
MNPSHQPIIDKLRSQAQAYQPTPPPHLNRRIREGLAAVEAPVRRVRAPWFAWQLAATVFAGALLAAALIYQQTRPTPQTVTIRPDKPGTHVKLPGKETAGFSTANLVALTHRWVDQPLQGEMENLLSDLSRTKDTVARVLPATKRAKPTTAAGTSQGA